MSVGGCRGADGVLRSGGWKRRTKPSIGRRGGLRTLRVRVGLGNMVRIFVRVRFRGGRTVVQERRRGWRPIASLLRSSSSALAERVVTH